MDRGIIYHHHGLLGDGITKGVKASDLPARSAQAGDCVCVNAAFYTERRQIIIRVEKSQNIEALAFCGGYLYGLSNRLPGVGNVRVQRKSGFIIIEQIKRSALVFFLTLQALFSPLQTPYRFVSI